MVSRRARCAGTDDAGGSTAAPSPPTRRSVRLVGLQPDDPALLHVGHEQLAERQAVSAPKDVPAIDLDRGVPAVGGVESDHRLERCGLIGTGRDDEAPPEWAAPHDSMDGFGGLRRLDLRGLVDDCLGDPTVDDRHVNDDWADRLVTRDADLADRDE